MHLRQTIAATSITSTRLPLVFNFEAASYYLETEDVYEAHLSTLKSERQTLANKINAYMGGIEMIQLFIAVLDGNDLAIT